MDKCTIAVIDLNDAFAGFTGTENYYRHWLPEFVYTDGIKAMAEKFQSYWLIDIPFSWQKNPRAGNEKFQIWTIVSENKKAVVEMRPDSDRPALISQEIPFTDFPEGRLKMYYIDDGNYKVLLLPSEY